MSVAPLTGCTPRLLVSIRSPQEACAALDGGCDLLDVKEPSRGPLGRADIDHIAGVISIRDRTAPHIPISVALGELEEWTNESLATFGPLPSRIQFLKLGLAGCAAQSDWPRRWAGVAESITDRAAESPRWIMVAYADASLAAAPSIDDVLAAASDLHCAGLLIDTFSKTTGGLLNHLDVARLQRIADRCHSEGLLLALAGRLGLADLDRIASLDLDILAVRSAACRNGARLGPVEEQRVRRLKRRLAATAAALNVPQA